MATNLDLYEIAYRQELRSKPIRDNFTDIENGVNDLQSQIDALATPASGAEVSQARDYADSLRDRLRNASSITPTFFLSGGIISEQSTPDMTVQISVGTAIVNSIICNWDAQSSGTITAPSANNRYDIVVINSDNTVTIEQGSESATPFWPSISSTQRAIASILLTPSTTSITDSDITDLRDSGVYVHECNKKLYFMLIQDAIDYIVSNYSGYGKITIFQGDYKETLSFSGVVRIDAEFLDVTYSTFSLTGYKIIDSSGINSSGDNASSTGNTNDVSGDNSSSVGNTNDVSGDSSVAIGYNNAVSGDKCAAIGEGNTVSGSGTNETGIAIGYGNTVSTLVPNNNGNYAIGYGCTVDGYNAGLALGFGNTNHGSDGSIAAGRLCTVTTSAGFGAFVGGNNSSVSASTSFVFGNACSASSAYSVALGSAATARLKAQFALGIGNGSIQYTKSAVSGLTFDATPTEIGLGGYFTIESNKIYFMDINISAVESGGGNAAFYHRKLIIKNVSGTTSLSGSVITVGTDIETNAAWNVSIAADNTNDRLAITVTGAAATTIGWAAIIDAREASI
jgi:hypothetical protein